MNENFKIKIDLKEKNKCIICGGDCIIHIDWILFGKRLEWKWEAKKV